MRCVFSHGRVNIFNKIFSIVLSIAVVALLVYADDLNNQNRRLYSELERIELVFYDASYTRHRYEQARAIIASLERDMQRHLTYGAASDERRQRVVDDLLLNRYHPELRRWEGQPYNSTVGFYSAIVVSDFNWGLRGFVIASVGDGHWDATLVYYYEILQSDGYRRFTQETENDGDIVWTLVASHVMSVFTVHY